MPSSTVVEVNTDLHKLQAAMPGTPEVDHPRHWRIEMADGEHDLFTVRTGRCRVHAIGGGVAQAGPGEAIATAAGFRASFEVIETLTKTYATVSPAR